jgi:microcystin-dependent protein
MKIIRFTAALMIALSIFIPISEANAQECFLGEVRWFAGNFAPRGWALAQGQLLPISQNPALFSILGTTYGGDGRTTFGLPDLRGRFAMGSGSGPGLTSRRIGQKSGQERVTLSTNQIPSHNHRVHAQSGNASTTSPANNLLAKSGSYRGGSADTVMGTMIENTGGSQSHENLPPFLVMNPIICLQGLFPSRS